jgi:hypothetical protein
MEKGSGLLHAPSWSSREDHLLTLLVLVLVVDDLAAGRGRVMDCPDPLISTPMESKSIATGGASNSSAIAGEPGAGVVEVEGRGVMAGLMVEFPVIVLLKVVD